MFCLIGIIFCIDRNQFYFDRYPHCVGHGAIYLFQFLVLSECLGRLRVGAAPDRSQGSLGMYWPTHPLNPLTVLVPKITSNGKSMGNPWEIQRCVCFVSPRNYMEQKKTVYICIYEGLCHSILNVFISAIPVTQLSCAAQDATCARSPNPAEAGKSCCFSAFDGASGRRKAKTHKHVHPQSMGSLGCCIMFDLFLVFV